MIILYREVTKNIKEDFMGKNNRKDGNALLRSTWSYLAAIPHFVLNRKE